VTLKAGRNALPLSDTLVKLTHLSLHSTSSQTLLESSSDENTFCWCTYKSKQLSCYVKWWLDLNRSNVHSGNPYLPKCKTTVYFYVDKYMMCSVFDSDWWKVFAVWLYVNLLALHCHCWATTPDLLLNCIALCLLKWGLFTPLHTLHNILNNCDILFTSILTSHQWLVLGMGPGNPPAVGVHTAKAVPFGSRPVQQCTCCFMASQTWTCIHSPAGFPRVD